MDKPSDEAVTAEVEKRLNDIFGPDEEDHSTFLENGPLDQESPLRNLKGIVLSIDWEITDEIMISFLEEIERLQKSYADERIPVLFLQLLGSVGKYIRNQKARAHPDSIRVLNSVYNSFEKVMTEEGMSEAEKRKWLYAEVNRFKKLKQDIVRKRSEKASPEKEPEPPPPSEEPMAPAPQEEVTEDIPKPSLEPDEMSPHEAFAYALEEIKQVIKAEFQALRAELRLWREGR